jgi:hypothetical protein
VQRKGSEADVSGGQKKQVLIGGRLLPIISGQNATSWSATALAQRNAVISFKIYACCMRASKLPSKALVSFLRICCAV